MKDFTRSNTVTQAAESHTLSRTEIDTVNRFNRTPGVFPDADLLPAGPMHGGVDYPAVGDATWPILYGGISCEADECDRTWVADVLGGPDEAVAFARQHAPGHGWSVTPAGDFCPTHATRKA